MMLEEILLLLEQKQSQEGDSGKDVLLELNWDALESSAQTMAALLSLFALAPIPWLLVSQVAATASLEFDLVVNRDILVQKYFLQKLDDNTYQLHERIREFLSIKGEQLADIETLKQGFCSAIVAIAKDIPETPTQSEIIEITPAIPHLVEVATNQNDYLNDEDLIWPFVGLGRFYYGQGAYEQALPWYEECLSTVRERLGENHPAVATSLNNLAALYDSQGRYEKAEPLYRQALDLKQRLLGEQYRDVATSLNNLAELYYSQGRYQEAEPLYRQALELSQRLLGEEHPDVAQSFNNLALLYWSQGRYEKAEPLYQQALDLRKQLLGEEHPDVATSLNNLALLYYSQGRYQEAEPLFQQALEMRKRLLGIEHPDVATSFNNLNLVRLYYSQGRYKKAKPLFQQALELWKRLQQQALDKLTARKKLILTIIKCGVSIALLSWALRKTNLPDIFLAVSSANIHLLIAAFVVYLASYDIRAHRWRILLLAQNVKASIPYLYKSYMVSIFVSNFLPSTISGDAVRVYDAWRLGTRKSVALATVFLDRFLGLLGLMLLGLGALFFSQTLIAQLPLLNLWVMLRSALIMVVISMIFIVTFLQPIKNKLINVNKAFLAFGNRKYALAISMGWSLMVQISVIAHYYLIAKALDLPVTLLSFFIIIPLVSLIIMLPVSINGIGIRENAFVFFFTAYGYNFAISKVIAFAWLAYGIVIIQGLLGGIVYALRK
ncbi:tetratricopeptide repeat protein [Moorena sp. SIO3H5]|uniref:tetratricopeptide repeat protein n=1 Tax=Moorena sp. SIO3H5 TaxID=2607834 RepID=UPI0013B6F646|nr:tetratricopeptide repeat protein [Moorena sp. SIO3H5]NEO69207.1 tetratricopeptide repeat protein [Moorena sp. SIO3H5]